MEISGDKIAVSIVVPIFNASKYFPRLLEALVNQNYQGIYEIILVDDGSSDDSLEKYESIRKEISFPHLKIVPIEHGGPAVARNTGALEAQGEIILFTDADCIPSKNWIQVMVDPFKDPEVAACGGSYRTLNKEFRLARFVGHDIAYRHSKYGNFIDFAATYSFAVKKEVLIEVGMFDQDYTEANAEDNDLSYEIIRHGHKIYYEPEGWVQHPHPSRLKVFLKQQYDRARWRIKLHQKNRRLTGDVYAGPATLYQPLLWGLYSIFVLCFLVLLIFPSLTKIPFLSALSSPYFLLIALGTNLFLIFLLNLKFLRWVSRNTEESFKNRVYFYIIIVLRSIMWFLGGIAGIPKILRK